MAEPYNDENKTIISRMQQRRGLKQDLPQPLRPGEFGFTVDSQQLYIGADPDQAPAYNKTSIYENTTGAVDEANTIMNNQMIYVTFPFKKYAQGEPTGVSNSFNWLPTSIRLTGVDTDPVFSQVVTSANSVKSIMTNDVFRATDLIVKRNSKEQEGNNTASYGTLVAEDYIFNQNSPDGGSSHNLAFRTIPQPSEEITVSYYDKDAIIKVLSNRNGGGGGNQEGFYTGTSFPSFYTAYNIPEWDQIDPELIQISDTSGSGYIGLEFKHVAPRAMGTSIENPNALTGLCNLILVTEGDAVSARLPSGNMVQTGSSLEIPVSDVTEFSLTSPNNIISLTETADSNWIAANSWIIESIDSVNSNVTVDISDSGFTHFPVSNVTLSTGSSLVIKSTLAEGLKAGAGNWNLPGNGTNGHCLKMVTGNVDLDPMFIRVTSYPTNGTTIGGDIFAPQRISPGVYGNTYYQISNVSSGYSSVNVAAIMNSINSSLTHFVNWGYGIVDSGNATIQPPQTTPANVVQVYSKYSNYNVLNNYDTITISTSSDVAQISTGLSNVNYALRTELSGLGVEWSESTQNTFFMRSNTGVNSNVFINHYPNLAPSAGIPTAGFVQDNTLSFDLSGVTNLNDIIATVNSQNDWPLLQLVPGETDASGNPNMLMLTLNPASTGVFTEFEIISDECGTAEKLGLTIGKYDESSTYKAKLEDYFADLLIQPDCPVINTVSVGKLYSTNPFTRTRIGNYELPFDETFQELNFNSREEALAFNDVVNNLYFQRSTSDIRGLVNIKSNLEIELKTGITIGDKTVTYVDMNGALDAISAGANGPTVPISWQDVLGARFNTSDYDSFALEYTIRESEQESGPGNGYQRIGTMYVNGRQDFGNGTGDVVFQDDSSEMVDTGLVAATTSDEGDPVPALHLRWRSDGVNIQLQASNRMPVKLTLRYILRRWNSLG